MFGEAASLLRGVPIKPMIASYCPMCAFVRRATIAQDQGSWGCIPPPLPCALRLASRQILYKLGSKTLAHGTSSSCRNLTMYVPLMIGFHNHWSELVTPAELGDSRVNYRIQCDLERYILPTVDSNSILQASHGCDTRSRDVSLL